MVNDLVEKQLVREVRSMAVDELKEQEQVQVEEVGESLFGQVLLKSVTEVVGESYMEASKHESACEEMVN